MNRFSVLTWNIAMTQPSAAAPPNWDKAHNLNRILDEIERYNPDFIFLQEMPNPSFTDYFSDSYLSSQVIETHQGYTTTFVRKGKVASFPVQLESQLTLPPLSGLSLHLGEKFLILFSTHLPPYKKNAKHRQGIITNLIKQLNPSQSLIIAGDMNMREAETPTITDLGLQDAYQHHHDPDREQYRTWDSTRNKYHTNGPSFIARFDRIFYKELTLKSYQLVGTKPQSSSSHYLSDHFGIFSQFVW